MKKKFLVVCAALALLGSAGCKTHQYYSGEKRSKDEVARIKAGGLGWTIKAVDGHEREATSAEVLPGSHTITVRRRKTHYGLALLNPGLEMVADLADTYEFFTITVYVEAGHTYRLEVADDGPRRLVLVDVAEDK